MKNEMENKIRFLFSAAGNRSGIGFDYLFILFFPRVEKLMCPHTHTHTMIFRAYLCVYVCFSRKSPSDVTSVIDAGEVTFPRSSASARVCEERLVVHLTRRSTGFDTPWLVTELSSRTQRVLMYIYASYTCAHERVCVCVCV